MTVFNNERAERIKNKRYLERRNKFKKLVQVSIEKRIKKLEAQKKSYWFWFFSSKKVDGKIGGWKFIAANITESNAETTIRNALVFFPELPRGRKSRSKKKLERIINFSRAISLIA